MLQRRREVWIHMETVKCFASVIHILAVNNDVTIVECLLLSSCVLKYISKRCGCLIICVPRTSWSPLLLDAA